MKVILNEYVANLGDRGAACEVRPGYGRNFLIPKGLAYLATTANRARFKQEQKQWDVQEAREKGSAEALASRLAGIELSFVRRAGEGDVLYGSVTVHDIAEALAAKGIEFDRRKIVLGQHIKRLGTFTAEVHLHRDVRVPLALHVEREGEETRA